MTHNQVFLLVAVFLFLQSCASLTGFQDGKTLGDKNWEASASFSRGTTPDFTDDSSAGDIDEYANIELGARYGVSEKFDLGVKINSNLNFAIASKYQFYGDRHSKNAMSAGLEIGTFTIIAPLFNVQLPLFYSHHFSDKFSWNISPRIVAQFNIDNVRYNGGILYYGGNTGFSYGKKHKLVLDLGVYNASVTEFDINKKSTIYTYGLGARFFFGDKDTYDSNKPKNNNKKRPERVKE
jgi:hypothetical protein